MKKKKNTTILLVGDDKDFDSYQKLAREKRFIQQKGYAFASACYEQLLGGELPGIKTDKVIVFVFFPFNYWDKNIEYPGYRGLYGNQTFYRKFNRFARGVKLALKEYLPDKELLLINDPVLSSRYRDKIRVIRKLLKAGVSVPAHYRSKHTRQIKRQMQKGRKYFIKPRCGSMGKGITFLELGNWQTNFQFRKDKICNRMSDYGWKFHDITGKTKFLSALLHSKGLFLEEAIESLHIKDERVDFRVYLFLDKVMYVYPRRNDIDAVTTNISQGGKGSPEILEIIPENMISRIEKEVTKSLKALGLKMAGIDVIVDSALKEIYIVDINMFPGFPKKRTFNLPREMIKELIHRDRKGELRYEKSRDIQL